MNELGYFRILNMWTVLLTVLCIPALSLGQMPAELATSQESPKVFIQVTYQFGVSGSFGADEAMRTAVRELGLNVRLIPLRIQSLADLGPALISLHLDVPIDGFLFSGHGNEWEYTFTEGESYLGKRFAGVLSGALEGKAISQNLVLIFNACLTAAATLDGNGFQENLVRDLPERLARTGHGIQNISVIGHLSTTNPARSMSPPGLLGRVLHRYGLLKKIDALLMKITPRNPFGPAFIHGLPVIAGTILQIVYSDGPIPHWVNEIYLGGILSSTVLFLQSFSSDRLVRVSRSEGVKVRDEEGFLYDLLPEAIDGMLCSQLFPHSF